MGTALGPAFGDQSVVALPPHCLSAAAASILATGYFPSTALASMLHGRKCGRPVASAGEAAALLLPHGLFMLLLRLPTPQPPPLLWPRCPTIALPPRWRWTWTKSLPSRRSRRTLPHSVTLLLYTSIVPSTKANTNTATITIPLSATQTTTKLLQHSRLRIALERNGRVVVVVPLLVGF